jgi:hypothetical protein
MPRKLRHTEPDDGNFFSSGVGTTFMRRFDDGKREEWEWARLALTYADELCEAAALPGYVCLSTVELDAEPRKFPDALAAYFSDADWDYSERFFVQEFGQRGVPDTYVTGRFTFEAHRGLVSRVLDDSSDIRWGGGLNVGGVQVADGDVSHALRESPFSKDAALSLQPMCRFGWAHNRNMNAVTVWIRPGEDDLLAALAALRA